jgi:hypothetical protein
LPAASIPGATGAGATAGAGAGRGAGAPRLTDASTLLLSSVFDATPALPPSPPPREMRRARDAARTPEPAAVPLDAAASAAAAAAEAAASCAWARARFTAAMGNSPVAAAAAAPRPRLDSVPPSFPSASGRRGWREARVGERLCTRLLPLLIASGALGWSALDAAGARLPPPACGLLPWRGGRESCCCCACCGGHASLLPSPLRLAQKSSSAAPDLPPPWSPRPLLSLLELTLRR